MESTKDIFKALIREFQRSGLRKVIPREDRVPDWCFEVATEGKPWPAPSVAVMITGPRRSGKTSFLYQLMERFCGQTEPPMPLTRLLYVNFEDDRLLPLKGTDLDALLDAFYELDPDNADRDVAVFLDEVHRVEGWADFVRRLLDRAGIHVFVTGFSSDLPGRSVVKGIPGRTYSLKLPPLNFREYLAFKGIPLADPLDPGGLKYKIRFLLDEYLIFGGFPEVVLADLSDKLKVLKDQLDLLVYKDMVEGFGIRNIALLKALIKHLVSNVGSTVSLNAFYLEHLAGHRASRDTVLEYVSYLERMDLISLVPVFSDSEKAQRVNPRRVFCLDNGFRNAISFRLAEDEERLARNLIFQTIDRSGRPVFFWKNGGCVDFVIREDARLLGINVVYGREPDPAATSALLALRHVAGKRETDLKIITRDTEMAENGIKHILLWKWLLEEAR